MNPSELLQGTSLPGGWLVSRLLPRGSYHTGGHFSAQYKVVNSDGREAFLKAIDLSHALSQPDSARALRDAFETFCFERDLLDYCREHRLSRVVTALHHGEIGTSYNRVYYLLFELADGDIRSATRHLSNATFSWRCQVLHQISVGLKQLHDREILHQDLKPSNVLVFAPVGMKLADLGRAYSTHLAAPHDSFPCAGDRTYAPPEILYGYSYPDRMHQRMSCDIYLLGSMIFWIFSGQGATRQILARLDPSHHWTSWRDTYDKVMPAVQTAFSDSLIELSTCLPTPYRAEIEALASSLCNPDPTRRNALNPRTAASSHSFDLQRVITRLDLLSKRSAIGN
jgi:serine/threonine protein kinase